jgi:hypothetical protein
MLIENQYNYGQPDLISYWASQMKDEDLSILIPMDPIQMDLIPKGLNPISDDCSENYPCESDRSSA